MATFAAQFTVSQSADCTTLTLTDTSNYVTNDEGYVVGDFSPRKFEISNSNGVLVETITLVDGDLTATYTLTQDQWLSVKLVLTGVDPVPDFDVTHSVLSTCFLEICYSELVADTECDCGCSGSGSCGCDSTQNDKVRLLEYIKAAEIFSEYSNPVLAQKQLDAGTAVCQANENN